MQRSRDRRHHRALDAGRRQHPRQVPRAHWHARARGDRQAGTGQGVTTVDDDKYYEEHAALLGHVTLAWNDCHYEVLSIFHTLSGVSWRNASAIFLALRSDRDRREITLELM